VGARVPRDGAVTGARGRVHPGRGLHSIVRNLSVALSLCTILVSVIVISLFSVFETRKQEAGLQEKMDNSIRYLGKILEVPMWNLDDSTIEIIGEAFFHDEDVASIRIRGMGDKLLYFMERSALKADISVNEKVFHDDRAIGSLEVAYSRRRLVESIAGISANMAITSCLVLLTIFLVTNTLIRLLIKKPLKVFSDMVLDFAANDYSVSGEGPDIEEFQAFERVLRRMGGEILGQLNAMRRLNESLEEKSLEKDALLRELYHRTKNNMQVICALISLQSDYLEDEKSKGVFLEIENRIHSMSLVHEKLYESHNLSRIGMRDYIVDLAGLLFESYKVAPGKIALEYDIDDVQLAIDAAIPCGLVLNELVSNAFKHAFPGGASGKVRISLKNEADEAVVLAVSDTGVGLGEGFDYRKQGGMGLKTVLSLGEGQLRGAVDFQGTHGTTCSLRFKAKASGNGGEASPR
jgi:two-component sensor histidine kinase